MKTASSQFELLTSNLDKKWKVETSISGYYRLICDGELLSDDSACEDVYDIESACGLFLTILLEDEEVRNKYPNLNEFNVMFFDKK